MNDARTVVDERGVTHELVKEIATGGQGTVWTTRTEGLLVKLRTLVQAGDAERLRARLDFIRRVTLSDLDVVVPASRLVAPDVGYVMEALTGMVPLEALRRPPSAVDVGAWYRDTGGLRKRLVVLAKLARTLAALHGRGLLYGDVAPANLWVSEAAARDETRLIDLDNVAFLGGEERLFTAHYGAPELELGSAYASSLSDAYAFAIVAFEVLTLIHPLYGDLVEAGDPDLEVEARAGRFPWVDDPEDDRNRSSKGVARELVLTKGLRRLCRETFGTGRGVSFRAVTARPGVATWADELEAAADRTTRCGCGATFFGFLSTCFACGARRGALVAVNVFNVFEPTFAATSDDLPTSDKPSALLNVGVGETRALLMRHLSASADSEPVVTVELEPSQVRLSCSGDRLVEVVDVTHGAGAPGSVRSLKVITPLSARPQPVRLGALNDYGLRFTRDGHARLVRFAFVPEATR